MTNFEKLKKVTKEGEQIAKEKEEIRNNYYNKSISYGDFISQTHFNDEKKQKNDILYNILKNNLYLEIHNRLMSVYRVVYKKYEGKAIGEKRQKEIRQLFENAIANIFQYDESTSYYNRFHLYFNYRIDNDIKIFEISIEKLKYNFSYYLQDDEIKSKYYIDFPNYVEDEEAEAERLMKLLETTEARKEEIEKELDAIKEELSNNFKKNLYDDKISRLNRSLTLNW